MRTRKTGIVLLVCAGAFCAPLAGAEAGGADPVRRVLDVRVQGNRRLSRAAVLAHVRMKPGHLYDPKIATKDRQRLLRTRRFESVVIYGRTTPQGVIVTVVVVERDLVAKIIFSGNRAFNDEKLRKELTFSPGSPLDVFAVEAGRRALRLKYRNAAYYFAEVSYDAQALRKTQQVVYTIVEGPNVRIRSIDFEGIRFLSSLQLKWLKLFTLSTSDKPWWWLLPSGTLKDDEIQRDVDTIRKRYVDEGFLDVAVSRKITFSADKTDARLTFLVRENARYYVNNIVFRGNEVLNNAELVRRITLQRGDVVKAEALHDDTARLRDTFGQFGYVDASVGVTKQYFPPQAELPEWTRRLDSTYPVALVDLVFTFRRGPQSRVGRIDIRPASAYEHGETITQRRIALREMTLFPGQLFSTAAAKESKNRILDTRIFNRATVKPIDPIDPIAREFGVRDAVVEIGEARTGNVGLGLGVSTNTGISGNIIYVQRNYDALAWPVSWRDVFDRRAWGGAGQTFRVNASPGTQLSQLTLNWYEPSVNDLPYTLNLRGFAVAGLRETYDENRIGASVSVGHRFKNGWYAELSSRTENVEIVNIQNDAPGQILDLEGYTFIQGIRGSLVRNRTDSRWKPSTGDVFKVSLEQVIGGFVFQKVRSEYRVYQTLGTDAFDRKHILSGKVWAGQIISYAPTFERYYGGGVGNIRGFRYRGISPRSERGHEPIGGDFSAYAGAEYTYPLAGEQLRGVIFLDSGTVHQDVEFDTWRVSTGFGVRLIIPAFGPVPVSLDFGFPLVRDRQDDTQLVSFTLGWVF